MPTRNSSAHCEVHAIFSAGSCLSQLLPRSLLYIERERVSKDLLLLLTAQLCPAFFRCVVNKSQSTKRPSQSCRLRNFSLSDLYDDDTRMAVGKWSPDCFRFRSRLPAPLNPQSRKGLYLHAVNREGIVHHSELLSLHRRRSSSVITQCHNTCRYRLAFERFKLFFRPFTTTSPSCPSLVCYKSLKPRRRNRKSTRIYLSLSLEDGRLELKE